jgi:hypothetical protein
MFACSFSVLMSAFRSNPANPTSVVPTSVVPTSLVIASRRRRRGNPVRLASATGAPMDRHGASRLAMTI